MIYRRPLLFLFLTSAVALFAYGEVFSWFSVGALFNHFAPCVQNPYDSAPCYVGTDVTATFVAFFILVALVAGYLASLWCKEKGIESCLRMMAKRRIEMRTLGIIFAGVLVFVFLGSIVTKVTVRDDPSASASQRECGHSNEKELFHDPLSYLLVWLGKVSVSAGHGPSDAAIHPYTIWHIPMDYLRDPQNYPYTSRAVFCNFADSSTALPPDATPVGWSKEEVTRYQESMQKRLRTALQSLDTLEPSADDLASWKTYHSQECGFSFKYPDTYFVHDTVTKTAYGVQCDISLFLNTQFAHDFIDGKNEADGLPEMTITASDLTPIVEKNNAIARAPLVSSPSEGNAPPDPQAAVTIAGESAKLSIALGIDVFDMISFYHGTRRYDLSTTESYEPMREDFYKIVKTLQWK